MGADDGSGDETAERAAAPEMAPRWLSGGRDDVKLEDNPAALAYAAFLRSLSAIFLREQKDRQKPPSD